MDSFFKIWIDGKLAGGYLTQQQFSEALRTIKELYPTASVQANVKLPCGDNPL